MERPEKQPSQGMEWLKKKSIQKTANERRNIFQNSLKNAKEKVIR